MKKGVNHVKGRKRVMIFSVCAKQWLDEHKPHWSAGTLEINERAVSHLLPLFKNLLPSDITPEIVSRHQSARKKDGASNRTISMEVGALRGILRKHRLWANLEPDVRMLRERTDAGRALSTIEVEGLLAACQTSRSRSLYTAVLVSIHTGLRNKELRVMRWRQVDFIERRVTVGKSKTAGGEGRLIYLSESATAALKAWRSQFPGAKPNDAVFPSERYGFAGQDGHLRGAILPYNVRPDVPISSWKVAWGNALKTAGVKCRWHDLRHTFVSRVAQSQVSDATLKSMTGHVSAKMMERYSHVGNEAKRQAIASTFDVHTVQ